MRLFYFITALGGLGIDVYSCALKPCSEDKIARIAAEIYAKGGGYMPDAPNITNASNAKTIMAANMIELKEVASIFPRSPEDSSDYEIIPFGNELLYFCSEPNNQYVLVPGLPNFGKQNEPLTVNKIRNIFCKKFPNIFAPTKELDDPASTFMDNSTCRPQWYLLSKKIIDEAAIRKFCRDCEVHEKDSWNFEWAIVYIYSWLMFRIFRNEEIFQPDEKLQETKITCLDTFSRIAKTQVYLEFKNHQIRVGSWRRNPGGSPPGIVPSLKHYLI